MGRGIDYGRGTTNIDPTNGIRYGVIHMNALSEWAWDDAEADYGNAHCPKCGNEAGDADADDVPDFDAPLTDDEREEGIRPWRHGRGSDDHYCEHCRYVFDSDEAYGDEPIGWVLANDSELTATIDSYNDVFILKSAYFTRAGFCSPCAPGAGHLESPCDDGERTYCLGHEWFTGGRAPYPVYAVATGEVIPPPEDK